MRKLLNLFVAAIGLFFAGIVFPQSTPNAVSLQDMRDALSKKTTIVIDIRERQEHATGVANGAKLIPMSELGKRLGELPKPTDAEFLLVCHTQNRSSNIVQQLQAAGYPNVKFVQGGMSQWKQRGWETVTP